MSAASWGLTIIGVLCASCVRDIAVGTRPEDNGQQDAGAAEDSGTPLTCEMTDCEISVLSTPVCEEREELSCVPEADACVWKCLVRPLVADEPLCGKEVCNAEQFCEAPLGSCGDGADAHCVARPSLCTRELLPVCGCDGITYANGCEAQRAGATLALRAACPAPVIAACQTECTSPPVEISTPKCPDGAINAPICADLGDGACSWVKRKCEPGPICPQPAPIATPGECWTTADCEPEQTCAGASVCPCDAECEAPNKPGVCA